MKFIRELSSNKSARKFLIIAFIVLFLIPNLIWYRPKSKIARHIGPVSDDVQILWTKDVYLWDYIVDWNTNAIYAFNSKQERLMKIDGVTGKTTWIVSILFDGSGDLVLGDQAVFAINSSYVTAFRSSTGELIWQTRLGDGHVSRYFQVEDDMLRIYYGDKIVDVSQMSGEILSTQPKDNIVWIQNSVEIHCPITPSQDGAIERCWVGLTGVDHVTKKVLWKNNKPAFLDDSQEHSINNILFVEFPGVGMCALNPDTGGDDWCLPGRKISNLAIDSDRKTGYFVREDFCLVKINLLSGGILAETNFSPKILPAGMQKEDYAYRVAITKDAVIVSFGDSEQTFGLKFNP